MIPLRLVLDTNIVVSAALNARGLPRTVLILAITRPARLYATPAILAEYRTVLERPVLQIRRGDRRQLMNLISRRCHIVKPARQLHVSVDPDDNKFIECAEAGRADYLVTGNLRHFPAFWKRTKIITARQLIEIAGPHLLP